MNLFESFRVAWTALRSNKLRSLLTMLGIIIGVGAVISLLAIGNGLSKFLDSQFDQFGGGVVYIGAGRITRKISEAEVARLTAADAAAIAQPGAVPLAEAVAVEFNG